MKIPFGEVRVGENFAYIANKKKYCSKIEPVEYAGVTCNFTTFVRGCSVKARMEDDELVEVNTPRTYWVGNDAGCVELPINVNLLF